jgi:hypothetical protein
MKKGVGYTENLHLIKLLLTTILSSSCESKDCSTYQIYELKSPLKMTTTPPKTYLDEPTLDIDLNNLSPNEKKEVMAYASSNYSTETDVTVVAPSSFKPTKTLLINSRGIKLLRFPMPSSELEIPISTPQGDVAYVSTRAKKSSGNAVLTDAQGKECVASEYLWGPGRNPSLRILGEATEAEGNIKVKGKWTSRSQEFVLPTGQIMAWRYTRERDPSPANIKGMKRTFLVLELSSPSFSSPSKSGKDIKAEPRRIAQLVRNDESRTPGTKSCDSGNGGELVIDEIALKEGALGEDVVVASCLMMLKKEIDRRRVQQMMVLMAVVSGGS